MDLEGIFGDLHVEMLMERLLVVCDPLDLFRLMGPLELFVPAACRTNQSQQKTCKLLRCGSQAIQGQETIVASLEENKRVAHFRSFLFKN